MDYQKVRNYIIGRLEKDLPENLFYHSVEHTVKVEKAVTILAKKEGIGEEDLILLKTAALFHDTGFLVQYNNNEPASCDIAREKLPSFGYNRADIDKICGMIMATRIPQCPQNHLDEILCDADLDHLGTDKVAAISETLRQELKSQGTVLSDIEWLNLQITFLKKHRYFTETAKKMRGARKNQYLEKLRNLLAKNKKSGTG